MSGSANPFLKKYDELNWSFIAALIVSFVALMFTFDAVSGEKETKTLALSLSNSVSRGVLLLGKYVSAVLSVMAVIAVGLVASLIIILLLGRTGWTATLAGEVGAFLIVAGLLAAAFAAFGLFASVVAPNSNVSLLLALSFWLAFTVVVPNSSTFIAKSFHPIDSSEAVEKRVAAALNDLDKNAPPGSWMMMSGNPFLPQHKLRADLQMKRLQAEKGIRDEYDQAMFGQFERTRLATAVSPVSLFEFITEAAVGGGYPRFRKVWDDLHIYQSQFLAFFKAIDAGDPKSPHWYNPNEDISTTRLPAAFATVPQFIEKPMSFSERLKPALPFLIAIAAYACLIFLLSYVLFVRYDVR